MAPKIPTVSTCCGYFELRTGALILAWIDVVASVLMVLAGIFILSISSEVEGEKVVVEGKESDDEEISNFVGCLFIIIALPILVTSSWFIKGIYDVSFPTFIFIIKPPFFLSE